MGEGYHNFHHQFPIDYRNAYHWYQYDPTKWFIALCGKVGLANNLKTFPSNEIAKGQLNMKLKELQQIQDTLQWPPESNELPVVSWETCTYTNNATACIGLMAYPQFRENLKQDL
jgi:stearoyl-CoA desaturase (delta-9 desaturase)